MPAKPRIKDMHAIEVLLEQAEGKTLEFKRDLSSPKSVMKSLVAFANTAGNRRAALQSDR